MRVVLGGVGQTFADRRGHSVRALDGVTLAAAAEEFVALLGPSGCGKSTLLNIVGGLLTPTEGEVYFEGALPSGRPPTAMVFQEFALFPWRTVHGNVEFGLEELGTPAPERRRRAREHIALMGLTGFEAKYPHQLSGGMRQRVGIARALAVDPPVLLMDEPFSALDAQTRQLMQEELLGIWERTRKTILYVTHNIHEAVYMADRVVVLSRRPGRVLAEVPVGLKRPRMESMIGDPAFVAAVERIWGLIKHEALGAGTALLLLVAAEMIAVESGIGFLVLHAGNIMATTKLMVGIVVLSLLGVLSSWALNRLERAALPWRN